MTGRSFRGMAALDFTLPQHFLFRPHNTKSEPQ
jgi:hypothetical protein